MHHVRRIREGSWSSFTTADRQKMASTVLLLNKAPAKTRYTMFDLELIAVYLAIRHFRHLVEGWEFHVITAHKPLTFALATASDKYSPHQIRHLHYISQFTTDIWQVAGVNIPVADALSHNAVHSAQSSPVYLQMLPQAQTEDEELWALLNSSLNVPLSDGLPTSGLVLYYFL